jgi:hypothetical protein
VVPKSTTTIQEHTQGIKEIDMKITGVALAICFSLLTCTVGTLYAQQPVNLTKVIEDKYAREIIGPYTGPTGIFNSAVKVIYESPKTVILQGDLITPIERLLNHELWQAMDLLRDQYGFNIHHIMTSGVGSEGNPTVVYILMTK